MLQYATFKQNTEDTKRGSFSDDSQDENNRKSIRINRKAPNALIPVVYNLCNECAKTPTIKSNCANKIKCNDCLELNQKQRNLKSFTEGINVKIRNGPNDFFFSKIGRNSKMIVQRENSCKTSKLIEDVSSSSLDTIKEKDQCIKAVDHKKEPIKTKNIFYKHRAQQSNVSMLKDKVSPVNLRLLQNLRENISKMHKTKMEHFRDYRKHSVKNSGREKSIKCSKFLSIFKSSKRKKNCTRIHSKNFISVMKTPQPRDNSLDSKQDLENMNKSQSVISA